MGRGETRGKQYPGMRTYSTGSDGNGTGLCENNAETGSIHTGITAGVLQSAFYNVIHNYF